MATTIPIVGQRGKIEIHADDVLPATWVELGEGHTINLPLDIHEYLPDQQANNQVQRISGASGGITGQITGKIGAIDNLDMSDWFTPGAYIAKEIKLTLTSGTSFTFDGFISNIQLGRTPRELQQWTADFSSAGGTILVAGAS